MAKKLKMDAANVKRRKNNKAEYRKYQSSPKRRAYRAELNREARKRGIYGKRASKGIDLLHNEKGKIVRAGSASKNRAAGARKGARSRKRKSG
jgi:hypothetical protein